ncbi:MAG TPA: DUF4375 domain-containing protein [Isosphaeraceae bacterium]|nr:DUF4375 domain-containing protein [Isosphaeraceae bacterium]
MKLLTLDDGNQTDPLVTPTVERAVLDGIQSKYKWTRFDEYDNRYSEYIDHLIVPTLKLAKVKRVETLWKKLNRPQKVFYAVFLFDGQVMNGGVWQFLYNHGELAVAALEALEEIGANRLASDYRVTLEEVMGKAESLGDLCREANQAGTFATKWAAFAEGYKQLETTEAIENYYHVKKFKKELYQQLCDYIEPQLNLFAKIRDAAVS